MFSRTIGAEIDLIADDLEGVGIGDDVLVQLVDIADHVTSRGGQAAPARVGPRRPQHAIDHDAVGQRFQTQ